MIGSHAGPKRAKRLEDPYAGKEVEDAAVDASDELAENNTVSYEVGIAIVVPVPLIGLMKVVV